MTDTSPSLAKYIGVFAVCYALCLLILNIVTASFDIQLGRGVEIGVLVASIYVAAASFAGKQSRGPSRAEGLKLALGSLAATYVVSLAAGYIALTIAGIPPLDVVSAFVQRYGLGVVAASVAFVTLLYFVMLAILYCWFGRLVARQQQRARRPAQSTD